MSNPLFYTLTNTCPWVAPWVLWTSKHAFTLSKPLDNGQLTTTALLQRWRELGILFVGFIAKIEDERSFAKGECKTGLAVILKISFGHFTRREWDRQNTQKALNRQKFSIEH